MSDYNINLGLGNKSMPDFNLFTELDLGQSQDFESVDSGPNLNRPNINFLEFSSNVKLGLIDNGSNIADELDFALFNSINPINVDSVATETLDVGLDDLSFVDNPKSLVCKSDSYIGLGLPVDQAVVNSYSDSLFSCASEIKDCFSTEISDPLVLNKENLNLSKLEETSKFPIPTSDLPPDSLSSISDIGELNSHLEQSFTNFENFLNNNNIIKSPTSLKIEPVNPNNIQSSEINSKLLLHLGSNSIEKEKQQLETLPEFEDKTDAADHCSQKIQTDLVAEIIETDKDKLNLTTSEVVRSPPVNNKSNKFPFKITVKTVKKTSDKMVASLQIPEQTKQIIQIPQSFEAYAGLPSLQAEKSFSIVHEKKDYPMPQKTEKRIVKKTRNLNSSKVVIKPIKKSISVETVSGKRKRLEELPFRSIKKAKVSAQIKSKKERAYQLEAFVDPKLERCRRNAINAKKNRDLKKNRMMELEKEVEMEREANSVLIDENENLRQGKIELEKRIEEMSLLLNDPVKMLGHLQKIQS